MLDRWVVVLGRCVLDHWVVVLGLWVVVPTWSLGDDTDRWVAVERMWLANHVGELGSRYG